MSEEKLLTTIEALMKDLEEVKARMEKKEENPPLQSPYDAKMIDLEKEIADLKLDNQRLSEYVLSLKKQLKLYQHHMHSEDILPCTTVFSILFSFLIERSSGRNRICVKQ